MVEAVRWRRGMIGSVVVFPTAEKSRGRQRVMERVVVRVRGEVWRWVRADVSRRGSLRAGAVHVVRWASLAVPHQIWGWEGLVGMGAVVLAQIHVGRRSSRVGAGRRSRPVVPVGAGSAIQAVTIRHEEGAVTPRFRTALGPVTVAARTRPVEPQRARSLRRQRISIIQDGGLSLSIPVPLYPSQKTFKLQSFLSGWGQRANRLLLALRMDG